MPRRRQRPRVPGEQPAPVYDETPQVDKKDERRDDKAEKKEDKRDYKIDKINSKAELLNARAGCFKWAAILLAIAAGVFFYFKGKLPI